MSKNAAADIQGGDANKPDNVSSETTKRNERGSLKGLIDLASDWDSPETNGEIAGDFA